MQISSINMNLPVQNYAFKGVNNNGNAGQRRRIQHVDDRPDPEYRRYDSQSKHTSVYEPERTSTKTTSNSRTRQAAVKKKQQKAALTRAAIFALAGMTAGSLGIDALIKHKAANDPAAVISHVSGAPQTVVDSFKFNGMNFYPEEVEEPIIQNATEFTSRQIQDINNAQDKLATIYYNQNSGICYAVLKHNSTAGEIKGTFGLVDNALDILNNLERPIVGANINTAAFKKGEVVKFKFEHAGHKDNFNSELLVAKPVSVTSLPKK